MAELPRELDRLGCRRALVVCGRSMQAHTAVMDHIVANLSSRCVGFFADVKEHSPLPTVETAARDLVRLEADALIAIGGGSAIVTARAASILAAEGRDARELCTRRGPDGALTSPRLLKPKLPIWIVPSTPTTAYGKAGSAVRDPGTGGGWPFSTPRPERRASSSILTSR